MFAEAKRNVDFIVVSMLFVISYKFISYVASFAWFFKKYILYVFNLKRVQMFQAATAT